MKCSLCGGRVRSGGGRYHAACMHEWKRRRDSNECVRCRAPDVPSGDPACDGCSVANAPYIGYSAG